jgi:GNAT superfamily N-acetyltransferase
VAAASTPVELLWRTRSFARTQANHEAAGFFDQLDQDQRYLLNLAVESARQQHGIGSALIVPVLARADRNKQPCYLETNNPNNLPFYTKHGFVVAHSGQVPNNGPAFWAMLRKPAD